MEQSIIWSLVVAIIGFLLAIIGVIWYELSKRSGAPQSIWVYILMLGGTITVLVGLVLITYFFIKNHISTQKT